MNKEKLADEVHDIIHSLRLIPNYKPSPAEVRISSSVMETFGETCSECKAVKERNRMQQYQPQSQGFFGKLFG